jgi:hypothetical protein
MKRLVLSFSISLTTLLAQMESQPATYEALQPVSAADFVPAAKLSSSLYTIAPAAQPDGLHLTYTLQGRNGTESVIGTQSLAVRTSEIQAITALDALDGSEEFGKALVKAAPRRSRV